jgi:hypothetical protein
VHNDDSSQELSKNVKISHQGHCVFIWLLESTTALSGRWVIGETSQDALVQHFISGFLTVCLSGVLHKQTLINTNININSALTQDLGKV